MIGLSFAPRAMRAQKDFEGTITYDVYTRSQPHTSVVTAKGMRLRAEGWDEEGKGQESGTVLVNAKGELLIVIPDRKMYLRVGSGELRLDNPTHAWTFTKTGRSETILGNSCDYYTMHNTKAKDKDHDLCITTSMGTVSMIPGKTFAGPDAHAQFPSGFVVLKSMDKDGKVLAVATKIDRHAVNDDLFEIGPDWKDINSLRGGRP